ncbi:MAG TPA: SH3 domain-containing protein [Anaerolineales bacterium]|nr:SH3 domain-containing protein [Anaerolineales bacterium]
MKSQSIYPSKWTMSITLLLIFVIVGCTGQVVAPTSPPLPSATTEAASPTPAGDKVTPTSQPPTTTGESPLFQDAFTNPGTGWDDAKLGNYFVGYHGPEWYHIEIASPNSKVAISEPNKKSYEDVTLELQVFAVAAKTDPSGDFRYGLAFRRSGDQYYAFTISPASKTWEMLKVSPGGVETLKEGTDDSIHDRDTADLLRVDALGSDFFLYINDHNLGQVTDATYSSGEVGLYAETLDNPKAHIHYDTFTIRTAPTEQPDLGLKFEDTFTNPGTGWDDAKLGNYFVGYHGPEWYHIEIASPNSKVTISEPNKTSYEDVTLELQVFAVAAKTDPSGDFRYGLAFRRSGDQYYAFTISPASKTWEMLKISPGGVETLKEGTDDSIHDRDTADLLRVDALGSSFLLHINDHLVGQVTDSTYPSGEVGLYAESLDNPKIHIHYDKFDIRDAQLDLICNINEGTFNVRSGPSKTFAQLAVLSAGDTLQPLGTSPNREWIQIRIEGSDAPGWVSYSEGLMSCTPSVDLFPIVSP